MFRAVPCSSSGGKIVLLQPPVSPISLNGRTVCRLRANSVRCQPAYCTVLTHITESHSFTNAKHCEVKHT